jgi:hypothetical protein
VLSDTLGKNLVSCLLKLALSFNPATLGFLLQIEMVMILSITGKFLVLSNIMLILIDFLKFIAAATISPIYK